MDGEEAPLAQRALRFSAGFRAFISFRHVTSHSSATKLANVDVFMASSISFSSVIETSPT